MARVEVVVLTFDVPLEGTIGLLGCIELAEFRDYLFPGAIKNSPPEVTGGTPVNLLCKELLRRRQLVVFSLHPSVESERVFEGERLKIYLGSLRPGGILNLFQGGAAISSACDRPREFEVSPCALDL
jgi:hypothetical protein